MMFALVTVPLVAATGAAIDYSRAFEQRLVVQDALDTAALAANRLIGLATEAEIYAEALAFFNANTEGRLDNDVTLTMVVDGGTVELTTELPVPTSFLGIIGIDTINFGVRSLSLSGAATYEVVMVLDNSTSMRGSKLSALKVAATDLVNGLFALGISNPSPDPIRVGLVPFSASVNVGAANRVATWMDTGGIAPNAGLNHDFHAGVADAQQFTNRFALYDAMGGVDWLGCVEARIYPHDVEDTTPTAATPITLFQPMFAPDEPPDDDDHDFNNNYLADDGGDGNNSCDVSPATPGSSGGLTCDVYSGLQRLFCIFFGNPPPQNVEGGDGTPAGPDYCDPDANNYAECLQERVCKYEGVYLGAYDGRGEGPNLHCTANALTPLSDNQTALLNAVDAMYSPQSPAGYTNIGQGIVWGWHALTDNEPFTEGRAYDEAGNRKILIVMTDGANTYLDQDSMNLSQYMAYNYITHGYLDVTETYPSQSDIVDEMNVRTLEVCGNIHDTEITVYTIAFQVDDDDSQQILLECASDSSKAFDADNNDELIAAFQLIAQDIASLRIAE